MHLLLALFGYLFATAELDAIRDVVTDRFGQYYSTGTYGHVQQIHALDRDVAVVEWHHDCLVEPRQRCAFLVLVVRDPDGAWSATPLGPTWRTPMPADADPWTF